MAVKVPIQSSWRNLCAETGYAGLFVRVLALRLRTALAVAGLRHEAEYEDSVDRRGRCDGSAAGGVGVSGAGGGAGGSAGGDAGRRKENTSVAQKVPPEVFLHI